MSRSKHFGCPWVLFVAVFLLAGSQLAFSGEGSASTEISFSRDIRPILSDHCFQCHGPDEKQREADLRLDLESGAKSELDGRRAIVAGDPLQSELWRRVTSDDDSLRMPPAETGRTLTPEQLDLIKRWIKQGAVWEQHWSFTPPRAAKLPRIEDPAWAKSPVDYFIAAKLESLGIRPNSDADKERLIRRVTFDLTGLPPQPDEVREFLDDEAPDAYERLVERLLASPRYGERMAWMWLDGARYADTSGYQNDGPREMWRWRDWVIDAFNANMPFDRFTVEQIAGDLLPDATRSQRIATGFNRNHRGNSEGGIIAEEYQVEYVVDRVDTTCTVWLGLTMGCARCHDHKFDPVSQKEFYRLYAYFNNIPEYGRAIKEGNSPPYIPAPTPMQEEQLAELDRAVNAAARKWHDLQNDLELAQSKWESTIAKGPPLNWAIKRGLVASFDFEKPTAPNPQSNADVTGNPHATCFVDGDPAYAAGVDGQAVLLDGKRYFSGGNVGDFGYFDKFSAGLWVNPNSTASGTLLSRMTDDVEADGWYVQLRDGHVQVNHVKRWLDDALRVETLAKIPEKTWTHIAFAYDGSRTPKGLKVYINGELADVDVKLNFLNQTFSTKEPLRIGGGGGPSGRFTGAIDEVYVYARAIEAEEAAALATRETVDEIAQVPQANRSRGQQQKITACFLDTAAPDSVRHAYEQLVELTQRRIEFVEKLPTVMVMEEMDQPRTTHVLIRGEYDKPGEAVTPGIPDCFSVDENLPVNRLGLAKWIASTENPLTARVFVNRVWQMHFGSGLVRSTEDFGVQGEPPTHPELLDWLAVEFSKSWDVKQLHRLIVHSAAYRQSARNNPYEQGKDPDNRWLSRGPRFRLSAEMIRDQALLASGLLVEQVGGPSVKPYQPADLWKDLATDSTYHQDHGANLYRRSLYTYWKRTVAPPSMMTFDAAGREACQVRTTRTNTPLQALTLLNEVTYVEAARVLAERAMRSAQSPRDRIAAAFFICTSRKPKEAELEILEKALERQLSHFRSDPNAADRLLSQGEFPRNASLNPVELAAYATLGNLLLNLDEVVTRQ